MPTNTPTDGTAAKLTDTQRSKLLAALKAIQKDEKISNEKMGRLLRCSRATWSKIADGKYTGTTDKFLLRGRDWMADRAARNEAPATDYVSTSIARYVMAVCDRAWQVPCLGKIITPSGAGKTAALKEFKRRRGDRALYLYAGEAFSSRQGLIMELADRLKVTVTTRSTSATMYRAIRNKLAGYYADGEGNPFCLLIDEATTLSPRALNVLRNLHDDPTCRCAVILADTARLDGELASRHGIAGGYEQLRSRFGAQYILPADRKIPLADVRAVAGSVLAAIGHDGLRLDRAAYGELHRIAQLPGKFRNVVYRLHAVRDVAAAAKVAARFGLAEIDEVADLVGQRRNPTLEHLVASWHGGSDASPQPPREPATSTTSSRTAAVA